MSAPKPMWLRKALEYLAVKEYPGKQTHNKTILGWWKKIRAPFNDDETPWCAAFVGGVLEECGILSSRSASARSYRRWGYELVAPCVGAVVVFWRGSPDGPFGHVGFIVGKDQHENLMVIGGNQGDAVTIKPFANDRVLSYHWPKSNDIPRELGIQYLPIVKSNGELSINEA